MYYGVCCCLFDCVGEYRFPLLAGCSVVVRSRWLWSDHCLDGLLPKKGAKKQLCLGQVVTIKTFRSVFRGTVEYGCIIYLRTEMDLNFTQFHFISFHDNQVSANEIITDKSVLLTCGL